jgi:Flp pilus assembly protein TadG
MATEVAIAMPALLLLVLVSVQAGLWFHARNLADAAAQQAARNASVLGATNADGQAAATQMLNDLGPTVVSDRTVTITRTATTVTVTVTGHAPQVIPGVTTDVTATATQPIEAFQPT